ncbi:hypothetical protein [Pseudonocardia xinjiangensis]
MIKTAAVVAVGSDSRVAAAHPYAVTGAREDEGRGRTTSARR